MNPAPRRLVSGAALWLQWTDAHGVRYNDGRESFDDSGQDSHAKSVAYREAAANTTYLRGLIIEDAIGGLCGKLDLSADPASVIDRQGRIVPRRAAPEACSEWESIATPAAAPQEVMQPHDLRPRFRP